MDYDFTFASKLSLKGNNFYRGTIENIKDIVSQLREDYCFDIQYSHVNNYGLVFTCPVGYSDIKISWLEEVMRYYTSVGVSVSIMDRKE